MTRINTGICVENLSDQHLLAEHREIKRIPRTNFKSKPSSKFTLGEGHVLFFSDKHKYTFNRYKQIYAECLKRGFNVEYYGNNWNSLIGLDYIPSVNDINIVKERIIERAKTSKQIIKYYGKNITIDEYIDKLK